MANPSFTFGRTPGTKVRAEIESSTLVPAQNKVVLIGHMASTPGSAAAGAPYQISNFGDPVAAVAECATAFGSGSELGEMVVAAIKAVLESDGLNLLPPPIVCIPLAHDDTSSSLSSTLNNLLTIKAPFVASCYAGTDSVALLALKTYLTTISGENRGRLGQFGSFGFMGIIAPTNTATPIGLAAATEKLCFPWMIDSASSKANGVHQIAAAVAALCAGNARPYNPLTDVKVGGLHAQVSAADWHTPGEAGTEELGLDAGLIPLMTAADGSIQISRTVTAYEPVANVQAADYFDLQDWQVLYDYRAQCYAASQSPQFKIAKASDDVAKALNSRFIAIAKAFEDLGMFQHVDLLAGQFTFSRSPANRAAFVYSCPANVVPGFMNKGVDVIGTTQFDLVV